MLSYNNGKMKTVMNETHDELKHCQDDFLLVVYKNSCVIYQMFVYIKQCDCFANQTHVRQCLKQSNASLELFALPVFLLPQPLLSV